MEDFDAAELASPAADSDASTIDDASVCDVTPVFDDDFIRSRRARNKAKATEPPVEDDSLPQDGLTETILDSRMVWRGDCLSVEDTTVRLPNGSLGHRDIVRHPGAVAVIALTDDGKIVLVHQYRTPLEQVTVEIPAGKMEPGEDPATAAARELMEETGYLAERMAYLGPIASAPGYSDELLHLYMAMGLSFVGASPDDDEFINVDLVDLNEMVDQVLDGKVIDAKTVVGILLCEAISRRMEA